MGPSISLIDPSGLRNYDADSEFQECIEQPARDCFSEDTLDADSNLGSAQNCLQEIIYLKVVLTVSSSKCGRQTTFCCMFFFQINSYKSDKILNFIL